MIVFDGRSKTSKTNGLLGGRPISVDDSQMIHILERLSIGQSMNSVARFLHVSRSTLYRALDRWQTQNWRVVMDLRYCVNTARPFRSSVLDFSFDKKILQKIATVLGVRMLVSYARFPDLIGRIKCGGADIALATITPTFERQQQIKFSDAYYESAGGRVELFSIGGTNRVLHKKPKWAVLDSTVYWMYCQKYCSEVELISVANSAEAEKALRLGKVDFFPYHRSGLTDKFRSLPNLRVQSLPNKINWTDAIGVGPGSFKERVDSVIYECRRSGFLQLLAARFVDETLTHEKFQKECLGL